MKYFVIAVSIFCLPFIIQAQCNCQQEFSKIKGHLESNYAGCKDKVTPENIKKYKDFTADKERIAVQAKNKSQCYFVINQWMSFFKDNHLYTGVNSKSIDKISPKKLQTDFPIEKVIINTDVIKKIENVKGIEGVYSKKGEDFSIAVLKNQTAFRDYIAVVIKSSDSNFQNGTVLAELKVKSPNEYCITRLISWHLQL
jgi:hypothetical protein